MKLLLAIVIAFSIIIVLGGSNKLTKTSRKLQYPPIQTSSVGGKKGSRSDTLRRCKRVRSGPILDEEVYPDDSEEDMKLPCCPSWNRCGTRLRGHCRPCSGCNFPSIATPDFPTFPGTTSTTPGFPNTHTTPCTPSRPSTPSAPCPPSTPSTPCEPTTPDIGGGNGNELPWDPSIPVVINPNYEDNPGRFSVSCEYFKHNKSLIKIPTDIFFVGDLPRKLNKRPLAPRETKVLIPEFNGNTDGVGLNMYAVERIIVHPACLFRNKYNAAHDIGIVKTIAEIEYGSTITPIKIPTPGYRPNGNVNWMITSFRPRHTIATTYRESVWYVKVRPIKEDRCSSVLNKTVYDPFKNFCTPYHHVGGDDNCQADFGASLHVGDQLVGILIHKYICGKAGSAASYVSVGANSKWLTKTIQELTRGGESV